MAGDIYYPYTSFLLHGDGSNGGTAIVDSSSYAHAPTTNANVVTSTDQSIYGGSSLLFNGSNSYLSYDDTEEYELGSEDFTLEAKIFMTGYCTTPNSGNYVVNILSKDEIGQRAYFFALSGTASSFTSLNFYFFESASSYGFVSYSYGFELNTWYTVAVKRAGSVFSLWIDNVQVATTTSTMTIINTSAKLIVGASRFFAGIYHFKGHIEEIRITKGVARDLSVVQTAAFPDFSGQISYTLIESLEATQFRLIASKISDGSLVKTAVTTASGVLDMPLLDAVSIAAIPIQGDKWQAGVIYVSGNLVFPTYAATHYFKRVTGTGGTSGTTEPTWINIIGDTTTDDGAWNNCWECVALLADSIIHSPIVPDDTSPPSVTFDFDSIVGGGGGAVSYLLRAWSPDNSEFVFWTDTAINLSPTATVPTSVVANLVNECVMM